MRADGPRDEVRALADALDTMLDRVEGAFTRERVFVAEASHELRTPLTVIRGQIEVLAADPDAGPADIARVERLVTAEVAHMSRLVDDLLVLAAPAVHIEDVPLQPLLRDLIEALAATTDRELTLTCDQDVVVRADRDRLGQAIRNVLANAIRHGRSTVLVRAERDAQQVRITVEDDGPGVPEAERRQVFDRFHRVDPSPASKGAGLGLAIVRAVAEACDGRVWLDASPALCGARVNLALPSAPSE